MMRASIDETSFAATLRVEGKLVGPWATELGNHWRDLWAAARQKPLMVDLCGLSFMDANGVRILREIIRTTGAGVVADSPLTQDFANRAKSNSIAESAEED